jgi:hypothetical protein
MLASEIYGMVGGINMAILIRTTLTMITNWLNLSLIPLIVCTDSYSLYDCLVRLSITQEKRLMINIIVLYQLYERRELFEIQWINGEDNPANTFTKAKPNTALQRFININKLLV